MPPCTTPARTHRWTDRSKSFSRNVCWLVSHAMAASILTSLDMTLLSSVSRFQDFHVPAGDVPGHGITRHWKYSATVDTGNNKLSQYWQWKAALLLPPTKQSWACRPRAWHSIHLQHTHTHTHRLTALCPGLSRWAGTWKVKPIWILLEQETVNDTGISWAICKSAPCSRQITTPAPHRSVFYRPDALPAAQPTVSKHWRKNTYNRPP